MGAARAAVRAGVPALAVSQGLGDPLDYPVAADLVLDWVDENRTELAAGTFPADAVVNLNVPTCPAGEVRGTVEVTSATAGDALGEPDCTATSPAHPADDVGACPGRLRHLHRGPARARRPLSTRTRPAATVGPMTPGHPAPRRSPWLPAGCSPCRPSPSPRQRDRSSTTGSASSSTTE